MERICTNILENIGRTPMVRLRRLRGANDAEILVKVEFLNPGGSIKSRSALAMIEAAENEGKLHDGSVIVEPTSGNQGVGLAMVGAVKGYQVKIIMPASVSLERKKIIEQYGAEVILIKDLGDIGKTMESCIQTALDLAELNKNIFVPQQFSNPNNPLIHNNTTAQEILSQIEYPIDAFCSGIGTGGTITGIGEALKKAFPKIKIFAVEPENGAMLSGGKLGNHIQQGIGDGIMPPILNCGIIDGTITVSDKQALETARRLSSMEGLLAGISSGSNVWAAMKLARELGKNKTVLTILPDNAERYFSTELFAD